MVLWNDDVVALRKVIGRTGGTIPNPNTTQASQPVMLPVPGHSISIGAEQNIKLAFYYATGWI